MIKTVNIKILINSLIIIAVSLSLWMGQLFDPKIGILFLTMSSLIYVIFKRFVFINKEYLIFLSILVIYIILSYAGIFNEPNMPFDKKYILRQPFPFFLFLFLIPLLSKFNQIISSNHKFYFKAYIIFLLFMIISMFLSKGVIFHYFLNGAQNFTILGIIILINYINGEYSEYPTSYKILIILMIGLLFLITTSTLQSKFYFIGISAIFFFDKKYALKIAIGLLISLIYFYLISLISLTYNAEYYYTSIMIRIRFLMNDIMILYDSYLLGNGFGTYNYKIAYDAPIRAMFDRSFMYDMFIVNSHNTFTYIASKTGLPGIFIFLLFFFKGIKPNKNDSNYINDSNYKNKICIWFILVFSIFVNPSYHAVDSFIGLCMMTGALVNKNNFVKIKF